jgi:hypothetical protein
MSSLDAPAALLQQKYVRASWLGGSVGRWAGPDVTGGGRKSLASTGIRTPDRPATLQRLFHVIVTIHDVK